MKKVKKIPSSNNLYMMIGIPASGKSTFAKKFAEENDFIYVSRDEVRYMMIDENDNYFGREDEVYREFMMRIAAGLDGGHDVIADATHLSIPSRKKFFDNLPRIPKNIIAIYIDTPFQVCKERNQLREGLERVPDQAMFNMKRALKMPKKSEGFDTILIYKNNQLFKVGSA